MSDMEESGKQNGRIQEHVQGSGWPLAWQVNVYILPERVNTRWCP